MNTYIKKWESLEDSTNIAMLKLIAFASLVATIGGVQFEIVNKEKGVIWIGIQGNTGKPHLEGGGFKLGAGQTVSDNM